MTPDARFAEYMQGKSVHRLRDAKLILQTTEVDVLVQLASWRKRHIISTPTV